MAVVDRKITAGPGEGRYMTDADVQDLLDELWQAGAGEGLVILHADTTWWRRRVKRMWATVERRPAERMPPPGPLPAQAVVIPEPPAGSRFDPMFLPRREVTGPMPAVPPDTDPGPDEDEGWRPGQLGTWPGPPTEPSAPDDAGHGRDGGAAPARPMSDDGARPASHRKVRARG